MDKIMASHDVSQKTSPTGISRFARYTFGVLCGISFLNYLDRFVFTGASDRIAQELHFNLAGVGYISSAFLIIYTIFTVPLGVWADRAKRKNVVAFCVTFWSLATALTALASNFTTLFLSRMLLGVGEAGYYPAGTALLSDYYSLKDRSRIMSWWSVAELFGVLGGYLIGGSLAGLYPGSWRLAFLFTGIPGLLVAFLAWRMREPRRNEADEALLAAQNAGGELDSTAAPQALAQPPVSSETPEEAKASFLTRSKTLGRNVLAQAAILLRIKTLVVLIVMQIFVFFVVWVNATFLPIYMQQKDTFGFKSGPANLYAGGIIVVAGLAGAVSGGYLADLLNRRYAGARVLICGLGFLLCAPIFAIAVTDHNLIVFTIAFALVAVLARAYNGPCTAASQDVVPSHLRASAVALSLLIAHLFGDAFSPTIVGVLATLFDPTHGQHFAHNMAGQDLSMALLITCVPALFIAGLVGTFGARWMAADVASAQRVDLEARASLA